MIPFSELQRLAEKIRDKCGRYCTVSVKHSCYAHAGAESEKRYGLYIEGNLNEDYPTVKELIEAMMHILEPVDDEGVSLEEKP